MGYGQFSDIIESPTADETKLLEEYSRTIIEHAKDIQDPISDSTTRDILQFDPHRVLILSTENEKSNRKPLLCSNLHMCEFAPR
jgi:hypothetical protein